jgi:4-amino-4-deoxy-L-arabinose transferase-like glycosyltransferase
MQSLFDDLQGHRLTRRVALLLAAVAALWLALAFSSAARKSATLDEFPHIGAGLSYLAFGDFRMNPEHPPLVKVLAAIPVLLIDRPDLRTTSGDLVIAPWADGLQNEWGWYCLFYLDRNVDRRLLLARSAPILIGLLGGWFVFLLGRELSRSCGGGLFAALLLLFYPEYLGHARFVTFDVPMAVAMGAVTWFAWRAYLRPSARSWAAFLLTAMLASQVKLPAAVHIALTCFALVIAAALSRRPRLVAAMAGLTVATLASGLLACWAGAGFRYSHLPPDAEITQQSPFIPREGGPPSESIVGAAVDFMARHQLLPETTLATLNHVRSFEARFFYLNGEWGVGGSYLYFFETFALKTPLGMGAGALVLCWLAGLGIAKGNKSHTRRLRWARAFIWVAPTLVMLAMVINARSNLGHRYILFVYVPLAAYLGALAWRWLLAEAWKRALAALLIVGQLASAASTWPHYATYFHFLIGSPYDAVPYLADSNIDWGQDLPLLAEALEELGNPPVNLALFSYSRPEAYGISEYRWILPNYPFQIGMPPAQPPASALPTACSLNNLILLRRDYPGHFDRDPDILLNSIVIYLPNLE